MHRPLGREMVTRSIVQECAEPRIMIREVAERGHGG
jgi:hypothetical protein